MADDGTMLCLTLKEARKLVEELMTETMRVDLITRQYEAEDA